MHPDEQREFIKAYDNLEILFSNISKYSKFSNSLFAKSVKQALISSILLNLEV